MAKTLTDLSQLTKAILKESPPSRVEPALAAQPAPTVSDEDREAEEVLAYFSRTPQNAPRSLRVAPGEGAGEDRTAELKAALEYPPGRRPAAKRAATRGAKDAALDAIAEEKAGEAGKKEICGELFKFKIRKNPPKLEILNESLVPKEFRIPQPDKIDKRAIMNEIRASGPVDWAEIVREESLQMR